MLEITTKLFVLSSRFFRSEEENRIDDLQKENALLREKISLLEYELDSMGQITRSLYWKKYCSHQQ
ncbi:MAG: hypothetical protein IPN70_03775 [Candidatus Moraniibacteriota bacterium]|nr:MAG: hypothetical protein IPN70_03775 [Candidatus Moranbacteria bacterium]